MDTMTLSYDPPKLVTSGVATLNFESFRSSSTQVATNQIWLAGTQTPIKANISLASFTSFRVGGPAEWYVAPQSVEELPVYLDWAQQNGLPLTLLGAGSNLLISDRGIPGLVLGTRRLRQTSLDRETGQITVAAGTSLPRLAWQIAGLGWSGLEWSVGIPGTIGGAVVMNAGAHNRCMADLLVSVQVLLPNGKLKTLTPADLHYSYRTSSLQGKQWLVTQATLQLQPGFDPNQISLATQSHFEHRRSTQPYHLPSCGSVFRNPKEQKAGWLIEQAGLKGYRIGGAEVAHRHANFILNCGGATASDIFHLICHVQQQVEQQWALSLEPEVKLIGEFWAA